MKKTLVLLLAAVPLLGQDCIGVHYEVTVEPKGDGFQRTLTAQTRKDENSERKVDPAAEELKRIAKLYNQPAPAGDTVTALFAERGPDDIGGAGFYTRYASPMGTVWGYIERIRGNDDLVSQIERIRKGVDQTVALLGGWVRAEMGDSPRRDKLCAFIGGPLRRDIENVAIYMWVAKFSSDHKSSEQAKEAEKTAQQDLAARLTAYVLERGYVRARDVPVIARAVRSDAPGPAFDLLRRFLATKMGVAVNQPVPEALDFLSGPARAQQSLEAYLMGTEQYKQLLAEHKRKKPKPDENKPAPAPTEVLHEPLEAFAVPFWGFLTTPDEVKLAVRTGVKPMHHNGKWDADGGKVTWGTTVRKGEKAKSQLPAVFWAVWSKPDEAFQTKHFGRLALSDDKLVEYCLWYHGLTGAEAKEWDAFVTSLKPTDDLAAKARKAFRVSGKDAAKHYAAAAAKLLMPEEKKSDE